MNFKKIEHRAYNLRGSSIDIFNEKYVNENIIEILNMCIDGNINLELNEKDFVKIINICYSLDIKDNDFFKKITKLTKNSLDYEKIINLMNKI